MKILHLDTGKTWRGGQNQIRLLLSELSNDQGVENYLAIPKSAKYDSSELTRRCAKTFYFSSAGQYLLANAFQLNLFCQKHAINLIHAHSGTGHTIASMMGLLGNKLPVIIHRRVAFQPHTYWPSRWKYFSKNITKYITVSKAIEDVLINYGVPRQMVETIYSSIEPREKIDRIRNKHHYKERLAQQYNISPHQPFYGTCAALAEDKGIETALQAFARAYQKTNKGHLFIAGEGPLRNKLQKQARILRISKQVTFLGHIKQTDLFLAGIDVLLFPSVQEGLGSTLLEAAFASVYVLASNVGGIPEIIKDDQTGILVPPGDIDAWTRQILYSQSNSFTQNTLPENLHQFVHQTFSSYKMAEKTKFLYQQTISEF